MTVDELLVKNLSTNLPPFLVNLEAIQFLNSVLTNKSQKDGTSKKNFLNVLPDLSSRLMIARVTSNECKKYDAEQSSSTLRCVTARCKNMM